MAVIGHKKPKDHKNQCSSKFRPQIIRIMVRIQINLPVEDSIRVHLRNPRLMSVPYLFVLFVFFVAKNSG